MRVLAGHDGGTGCAWYRMIMPLAELGRRGHQVTIAAAGTNEARSRPGQYDILVAQRLNEYGQLKTWRRLRAHGRLVYEVDDDVFSVEPVNWQAYSTYSRADILDAVAHSAEVADLVTVTCEPLAQVMRQYNPNVAILPNHVPGWVLDLPRQKRARPVIGWAGGTSHGRDIQLIARPLRQFLDRHPGWDAHLCGTDFRPAIRHGRVSFSPWVAVADDPEGYYRTVDFDIGLAPLYPTVFSRSKSHIKALEYAARGIPVIASDSDPYRDFVLHGVTGFLVKRDHEWLKYMSELAADDGLRAEMGAKAREHARAYVIEDGWKLWQDAYGRLLA